LIDDCGVIDPRECETEDAFRRCVRDAYRAYRRKYQALLTRFLAPKGISAEEFRAMHAMKGADGRPVVPTIKLLGVWDTVDAVGLPFRLADVWNRVVWRYKFETTSLCEVVEKGCHALALDDGRAEFAPVLWSEDHESTRRRVEQVWFAGAHSNVGGGYSQQGMSLVALDWMMKQAELQGLRFVRSARDQFRTMHSFADKLYDPRSGLGMFYRWKPRDVAAICAGRGIAVPKVHLSVIERIVQAPQGYAPGNIPERCEIVATEDDPAVRLGDVAAAVQKAQASTGAPSLPAQKWWWIPVGLVAYGAFIVGIGGAAIRALTRMVAPLSGGVGPFVSSVWGVFTTLPFGPIVTVARDRVAAALLVGGLAIGYGLSAVSDRRMRSYYSGFWHVHRVALRTALRRTPAPDIRSSEVRREASTGRGFETAAISR
jgi:hypothetical protein